MRIAIIGGGIVGLASAWFLARDGHDVTVVEREAEVGRGTSFANGGQLAYSYVAPMASPSVLRSLPKYLLSRDSPVRVVPRADPAQWRWLIGFLRACDADAAALATARLLALSFHSRDMLHALMAETGVQFDHRANGKLVVQSTTESQLEAEAQLRLQASMGCDQQALTADECIAIEPSLSTIRHRLVGGILTPSEEVGDCHKLCEELRRVMTGRVRFMLGTEVTGLRIEGRALRALRSSAGDIEAELFVLAAGVASRHLARAAGLSLPVQPIRGYSISPRVKAGNRAPVRSITDTARKTVYAPIADRIRAAGFAEVAGDGTALHPGRIATLLRELEATFPGVCDLDDPRPWTGLRPATPTSLPAIGPTRVDRLMVNAGQGALGFTLATGSAKLLADLVAGRTPAVPAADYAPP